ncbi:hypothetical protein P22_2498 [Propionispora sp. 2/2-37]|uniref:DUF2460 domain-containing protein n=1 Tax=Propionispora sp. 2/2-37 TaxID=1677858 RepID=UPI0006BB58CF|nr:DUF2460 domain-containing protein [Propionispora sp. 2/2-37]CUH96408.1 hypothetical protein P22_2498 [Propionispora sp. 2/2-37]
MQAFHEVQFPPDISYGVTGGPEYSTDVVITGSGYEQRNINWSQARCKYQAAHGVKNEDQMRRLLAFFRARRGKAYGFRFKDWLDFRGKGEYVGTGDGKTTTFQLIKTYIDDGGYTDVRKIRKPVVGTVKVYMDGIEQQANWSVNFTNGIITFVSAPAQGTVITADFEFDVPVRFDTDHCPQSIKDWNIYGWDNIPLVEIRV